MQIDFHHGVTYVVSRLAGLTQKEASTVAYCAQYVDDATNSGTVFFDNGATYQRIAPAHKTLDYRNFDELANHHVWIPFHFLPGNDLKKAEEPVNKDFIHKLVCRPGSHVAEEMVRDCILDKKRPYGLHRLGITMHVYVDTWAHYGFAGVVHKINSATEIDTENGLSAASFRTRLKDYFMDRFDDVAGGFVGNTQPLGHGCVLSYPDQPYLKWRYVNGLGMEVVRNNPDDYIKAVEHMHSAVTRFRLGDLNASVTPIGQNDMKAIRDMLWGITTDDGHKRHSEWKTAVANGKFSFGKETVEYIEKGEGSWKHAALGTTKHEDIPGEKFTYKPEFLTSNWKMFHDAALAHRFNVLHHILPRYGICAG